ncbi:MAG: dienelactone hydrolase family protein [Pyrinomonadaceae bacterium]|nr:dienelactone hydrolase family protein [Pyrinomonadaceae bacterium]
MKRFGLIFWLIFLITPLTALASEKITRESIQYNKSNRTFYLFVPDTLKTGSPAPLIMLLHGSGRNGLSLVEKWKELASKEGVILVGPDASDASKWSVPKDGPDFLREIVETLKTKYTVNPRRVYLFGHSGGAVFALNISMLESEYFAATAVHAGAWREPKEYELIKYAARKIPLAIWVGTNDLFFPLDSVRATRDALRAQGIPIEVTEMKGHDHWYYSLASKINQNAWEFLKRHELEADQQYTQYNFR